MVLNKKHLIWIKIAGVALLSGCSLLPTQTEAPPVAPPVVTPAPVVEPVRRPPRLGLVLGGGAGERRGWGAGGKVAWASLGFAFLFAMQVLAGHTQTAFISGVMIVVWIATSWLTNYLLHLQMIALK